MAWNFKTLTFALASNFELLIFHAHEEISVGFSRLKIADKYLWRKALKWHKWLWSGLKMAWNIRTLTFVLQIWNFRFHAHKEISVNFSRFKMAWNIRTLTFILASNLELQISCTWEIFVWQFLCLNWRVQQRSRLNKCMAKLCGQLKIQKIKLD